MWVIWVKNTYKKKIAVLSVILLLISSVVLSSCSMEIDFTQPYNYDDFDYFSDASGESQNDPQQTDPQQTDPEQVETKPSVEDDTEDNITTTSYSYDALPTEHTKDLYMKIAEIAQKDKAGSFSVDYEVGNVECFQALVAYKNDHPEVFWLEDQYRLIYKDSVTTIAPQFIYENNDLENAKQKFNETVESVLSNAPKGASDYELELYFNDYIVKNCSYDHGAAESDQRIANEGNAYGVFVDKKAVCEGYARAFQALCNRAGIECVNVFGEGNGEPHHWSCVNIEGEWYHIDVTWNDSDKENSIFDYNYFNVSTDKIKEDHKIRESYKEGDAKEVDGSVTVKNMFVPECTSMKYNYYEQSCISLKNVKDSDEVVSAIAQAGENEEKYCIIKLDESLDYEKTIDKILNDGYLYNWIEEANKLNNNSVKLNPKCSIYKNEKFNVFAVELKYQ